MCFFPLVSCPSETKISKKLVSVTIDDLCFLFLLQFCRVSVHGDRPVPKKHRPKNRGDDHDDQRPVGFEDHAAVEMEDQDINIGEHAAAVCRDKDDIPNKVPTFLEEMKNIFPAIVITEEDHQSR
jgi:hypothetical protein